MSWADLIVIASFGFAVGIFVLWLIDRKVINELVEERDAARNMVMYYVNKERGQ